MGRPSFGLTPIWTRRRSSPSSLRTSWGNPRTTSRLSPSQASSAGSLSFVVTLRPISHIYNSTFVIFVKSFPRVAKRTAKSPNLKTILPQRSQRTLRNPGFPHSVFSVPSVANPWFVWFFDFAVLLRGWQNIASPVITRPLSTKVFKNSNAPLCSLVLTPTPLCVRWSWRRHVIGSVWKSHSP